MTNPYEAATLPEIRTQLEIAQMLAKSHVSFVVVPVRTRPGFDLLISHQRERLEAIAQAAEKGGAA